MTLTVLTLQTRPRTKNHNPCHSLRTQDILRSSVIINNEMTDYLYGILSVGRKYVNYEL